MATISAYIGRSNIFEFVRLCFVEAEQCETNITLTFRPSLRGSMLMDPAIIHPIRPAEPMEW